MGTVFIISHSLKSLNLDEMTTSSEKYQLRFAIALSQHTKVKILSASADAETHLQDGNLEFIGVQTANANRSFFSWAREKQLFKALKANADDSNLIIFWGYSLRTVLTLLYAKLALKMAVVSFIFDTHKTAMSQLSFAKRIVIDSCFCIGQFLTRFFNGYILFQEKAIHRLKAKEKNCLILKPGVNETEAIVPLSSDTFRVGFCGTFSHLNGVDTLLKTLPLLKNKNVEISICGYGDFQEHIRLAEQQYPFFHYHGTLNDQELISFYQNCDLLLNLRHPDDQAMDFAFPSKLFEYASTGIPVVTTPLLPDEEFLTNVYLLQCVNENEIAEQILAAYHNRDEARLKGLRLKQYVEQTYSFRRCAEKVFDFIQSKRLLTK